ncbi:glycosyltransferase [Ligilactobacillus sp. LYQ60]|uniref:glycosyltransferase n=1 Tax=unclassified Ligilactobacillus TaxID=2767920 RepID=UPI0038520464
MVTNLTFICPQLSGNGGTEVALVKAVNALVDQHDITVILSSTPSNPAWLGQINPRVRVIANDFTNSFAKAFYFGKLFIGARSGDHFIILAANLIKYANIMRRCFHKQYTITSWIHYSLDDQQMFNADNILFADNHWAISSSIKKQLINRGISEKQITLVYNAVDEYNGKLNQVQNDDVLRLVYIGRIELDDQKNLRELMDGLARYSGKFTIDFYGDAADLSACQQYSKKVGISSCARWHGWVANPWDEVLKKLHPNALVLTSRYEGLPMTLLEGISRGIPVIVADFVGYCDVVEEGLNGFSYPRGNQLKLAKQLKRVKEVIWSPEKISQSIKSYSFSAYKARLEQAVKQLTGVDD